MSIHRSIIIAIVVVGSTFALPLQSTAASLPVCLTGSTRPVFGGHNFPLEVFPGEAPFQWVDAFPQLSFDQPLFLTHPPDGSGQLFVVEREGRVRVFANSEDADQAPVFLDVSDQVEAITDGGLLGLAFDPDYQTNGHFYLNMTSAAPVCDGGELCTRILRYTVTGNPEIADPASAVLLLEFEQPFEVHNGGMIAFGPDDLLYIATGDGGFPDNAQDRSNLLGSILRIDPSNPGPLPYGIPPSNPFVDDEDGARDEIWAYGLRNPWRFSFDRATGDLWIGDVGQSAVEEVDFVPASEIRSGGFNFGWPFCEGTSNFDGRRCSDIPSTPPRFEYDHGQGNSVTGGYVYRGSERPELQGTYVFADFGQATRLFENEALVLVADNVSSIASLGEDAEGEIYATDLFGGRVLQLEPGPAANANVPGTLSETGLFEDVVLLVPREGLIEYEPAAPLWSDGAAKRRWIGLPRQERIEYSAGGNWNFPIGTVLVKHFELTLAGGVTRRVETRAIVRINEGWLARTYRWSEDETEAFLLADGEFEDFSVAGPNGPEPLRWQYPSPSDCMTCHTLPEARVLGVRARQLDHVIECDTGAENQLEAWDSLGLFDTGLGSAGRLPAYDPADSDSASLGPRVRAHLAANCSMCHQPLAPAPGGLDFRFDTPVSEMNLIDVVPSEGSLGLDDPARIRLGAKERSVLWHRMQSADLGIRMARGTSLPDATSVQLVGRWIDESLALDTDSDGVQNEFDNCVELANTDQTNTDSDEFGNVCDCDFDGDGKCDVNDATLFGPDLQSGSDRGIGSDMDGSGVVDDADVAYFERGLARGKPGPVPEPGTFGSSLAAMLGLRALARWRRRK